MDQTTAPSDSWADPERHPLDDERTRGGASAAGDDLDTTTRRGRGLGANRHLASIVLALVAVPVAYGFIDYGYNRAMEAVTNAGDPSERSLITIGIAAGLFWLAALTGRISALGPLVAGLVWGAAPLAWVMWDYSSFVQRLNDLPEFYDNTGFGLYSIAFALFPAVAGLLIGTAFAGRWRRHRVATTG